MSLAVDIEVVGLDEAGDRISRLFGWQPLDLMDTVGRAVQEQTRDRIANEKASPDGKPWPESEGSTGTLVQSGALMDSIDYRSTSTDVTVGSPLPYARIHQEGGVIEAKNAKALRFTVGGETVFAKRVTIPARPYLGVSAGNRADLQTVISDYLASLAGAP